MEQIVIHSKEDLSPLWQRLKESFPENTVTYTRCPNDHHQMIVPKKFCAMFYPFLVLWIHECMIKKELARFTDISHRELTDELTIEYLIKINDEADVLCRMLEENLRFFVETSDMLSLDGFFLFGTRAYQEELGLIFSECMEEYHVRREYDAFLGLLHTFVEAEECRFGELTVAVAADHQVMFYDSEGQNITREWKNRFYAEFQDANPQVEDLIISILIAHLPSKISLYGGCYLTDPNFIYTLQYVFGDRIRMYHHPM